MRSQRIVVKLGTSTLTAGTAHISLPRMFDIVRQVVALANENYRLVLVSSGAIAAGRETLHFPELPRFVPKKQMLAAVGQPHLMGLYDQFFRMFGATVAQVLLTRADLTDRRRYLNARSTMEALLTQKVIPIVNENDTVATEEIRFGDNDTLSAQVANLVEADILILLTDQAGLYTSDPRLDPHARLIPEVNEPDIPPQIWQAAGGSQTGLGTGGMLTKLQAADLARRSGTRVVIAQGGDDDVLIKIARNERVGTNILPIVNQIESRKRFLLTGIRSTGILHVDTGAERAIKKGGSLLPIGISGVEGSFESGDTVKILTTEGKEMAVGMTNYESRDLQLICRHQSSEIETILGFTLGDEVIHHNNMVLL